jgi:hypothetical protein
MEHHQADTLRSQGRFTFAQVPLVMRKDPELQLADIAVTMFVLPWLDRSGVGWVAVPTISRGARLPGGSPSCRRRGTGPGGNLPPSG